MLAHKSPLWKNKNGSERVHILLVEVPINNDIADVTDNLRYAMLFSTEYVLPLGAISVILANVGLDN